MSVVKLERDIMLGPSFGHHGVADPRVTYKLQPHLHRHVTSVIIPDDRHLTRALLHDRNLCVPLAIILKLERTQHPQTHIKLAHKKKSICLALSFLRYQELRTEQNNFKILQSDYNKLESINTPFDPQLLQLYPFLRFYSGFAINSYRLVSKGACKRTRFTNTHLSQNWNNSQFFQIDLLESDGVLTPPVTDHVLTIGNWPRFVSHRDNGRYTNACRSCLRLYPHQKQAIYQKHILKHCTSKATDQRRPRNHIIHRAFLGKKTRTGEKIRNVVAFNPKNYRSTFQTLLYGTMDFEATSKKAAPGLIDEKAPSSTIMFQKPFAVSLCYTTPYNIPLPQNLADTVVKFFDERETTLNDFTCLYF